MELFKNYVIETKCITNFAPWKFESQIPRGFLFEDQEDNDILENSLSQQAIG